jgi:hypothetical protein
MPREIMKAGGHFPSLILLRVVEYFRLRYAFSANLIVNFDRGSPVE